MSHLRWVWNALKRCDVKKVLRTRQTVLLLVVVAVLLVVATLPHRAKALATGGTISVTQVTGCSFTVTGTIEGDTTAYITWEDNDDSSPLGITTGDEVPPIVVTGASFSYSAVWTDDDTTSGDSGDDRTMEVALWQGPDGRIVLNYQPFYLDTDCDGVTPTPTPTPTPTSTPQPQLVTITNFQGAQQSVADRSWLNISGSIYDGNPVQFSATIQNNQSFDQPATLQFVDGYDSSQVLQGAKSVAITIPANQQIT